MPETIYSDFQYQPSELKHKYGDKIHLAGDPLSLTRLEKLGRPSTMQPVVNDLIKKLYQQLLAKAAQELPFQNVSSITRMTALSGKSWEGQIINPECQVVISGIARAGTMPAEELFSELCQLINPLNVRLDHLYMARAVDSNGAVIGTNLNGHKIGGSIEGSTLIIPDPMGATGGTVVKALELYKALNLGVPRRVVALHLIITPEYIKRITAEVPEIVVYALRLDRGLSSEKAQNSIPGLYLDEERGLNDDGYIIPGLGGVGEIMSNSYV